MAHPLGNVKYKTFHDNDGIPLANGKLYTYIAGTSTPQVTYTNKTESGQNTNPVILDELGQAQVWLGQNKYYKLILKDEDDNTIWTEDNVAHINQDSITKEMIAADVAGDGLAQDVDGSLKASIDDETIGFNVDKELELKDYAVSTEKLQDESVTTDKLAADIDFVSQIENVIEVVFTNPFDFTREQNMRGVFQYPWSAPTKVTDPGTTPTGNGKGVAWSPNGEYLACAHFTSPYITIYQKHNYGLVKLADPGTLPTGNATGCAWSPSGEFLAVSHSTSPFVTIYQRQGSTFTKLADPSSLPASHGRCVTWSPNGEFLVVGHTGTPYITIYQVTFNRLTMDSYTPAGTNNGASPPIFSGTPAVLTGKVFYPTFTKLSNPASLPTTDLNGVAFSPNGEFLACAHGVGGGADERTITIYQKSSLNTFTKLSDPADSQVFAGISVSWSPDSQFLAFSGGVTPFICIYQRSNTTFTKLSNPANIPPNDVNGSHWSPNGKYLALAHTDSPYLFVYERSNTTFTKLSNLADTPAGNGNAIAFSPNNKFLAMAHDGSPYVHVVQTAGVIPTNGILYAREVF